MPSMTPNLAAGSQTGVNGVAPDQLACTGTRPTTERCVTNHSRSSASYPTWMRVTPLWATRTPPLSRYLNQLARTRRVSGPHREPHCTHRTGDARRHGRVRGQPLVVLHELLAREGLDQERRPAPDG